MQNPNRALRQEVAFINFFRAIAAFWVLLAHCMIWGGWYWPPLPSAKIAVDLFMIISGYLMALTMINRQHLEMIEHPKTWARFWIRRFFRIAPAYYLSLFVAVLLKNNFLNGYKSLQSLNPQWWPQGGTYDPSKIEYTVENIIWHLTFAFGLHPEHSFSTFLPDWSLSLEMQFYLIFPLLLLAMMRLGFLRASLTIGVPVFLLGEFIKESISYYEPSLLIFKLNYFIAGILIFYALAHRRKITYKLALLAISVFLVSIERLHSNDQFIMPVILLFMIILGFEETSQKMPKWGMSLFESSIVGFASKTSYGVYLFHGFFISLCGSLIRMYPDVLSFPAPTRVLLMFLFCSISSYSVGWAVYRLVELPSIRLGKNIVSLYLPLKN